MSTNIHLKFNNGNTALVWTGSGMATLESLGLATRAWVERLQNQVDETTTELAAESEMVAALQAELTKVTEAATRQVAAAREEERDALIHAYLTAPLVMGVKPTQASMVAWLRATPLTATPLAERIAELEGCLALRNQELDDVRRLSEADPGDTTVEAVEWLRNNKNATEARELKEGYAKDRAEAERDALKARVAELEEERDAARAELMAVASEAFDAGHASGGGYFGHAERRAAYLATLVKGEAK